MASISKKVLDEALPAIEAVEAGPEWVFIEIPDRDLLDYPFAGIGINLKHFGGPEERMCDCADYPKCKKTRMHKVTPELAREISERLTLARAADLRIYNNRRDMKALVELVKNNPSYQYFDPNTATNG